MILCIIRDKNKGVSFSVILQTAMMIVVFLAREVFIDKAVYLTIDFKLQNYHSEFIEVRLIKLLFRPALVASALFILSFAYYANAALNFPVLFNLDNHLNYAASSYIAKHHKIPVVKAGDKEIVFTRIGTTRSLRPPLTFIVSAVASNIFDEVVSDSKTSQRLGASLIGAFTVMVIFVGFWIAFNHVGLALVGASVIGLLPKFVFLASCNNDDIGAILSVSVLFSSVLALIRYGVKAWVLAALALSLGLVLQTKYTAWLTLPWFGLFCVVLIKHQWRKVIRLTPLLVIVCIASGGWWVLFNMVNYGVGDPSAMNYAAELQSTLSNIEPNRQGFAANGIGVMDMLGNYDQFLSKSYKSLIGYLEWIELDMGRAAYLIYGALFAIGIVGVGFRSRSALKEVSFLEPLIVLIIVIQCVFYVHHNLVRDIQPQARYVLPIIMPLVYLFLRQLNAFSNTVFVAKIRGREYGFKTVACVFLITVFSIVHVVTFDRYVVPAFIQGTFETSVKKPTKYDIRDAFEIVSSNAMSYEFVGDKLVLQRTSSELSSVTLNPRLCDRLPLNALITMNVSSSSKGGFHLRLDRFNRGSFESVYWRSYQAGQSTAMFSVSSKNCSGVKITLPKNTYQLSLWNLEISELRIHQYGKPI